VIRQHARGATLAVFVLIFHTSFHRVLLAEERKDDGISKTNQTLAFHFREAKQKQRLPLSVPLSMYPRLYLDLEVAIVVGYPIEGGFTIDFFLCIFT
jgi:hypothetical protein